MVHADEERFEGMSRAGLGWLICARLLLAGLSLGLAVILDRLEAAQGNQAIWGVYWTVIAAFLATIGSALMVPRTRDPERFATVQVCIDVTIVTSLVYFSGAGESVFTFLYALVVLYGAIALSRSGVFLASGLAATGFATVLFGSELGILPSLGLSQRTQSLPVLAAYWAFYAGALLVLGMLAHRLSAELRRTGAALDRRTHDLRRLRNLHHQTVESMGSGLLTTDETGTITSFNPEAERITGLSAAQAEGRQLSDLIPGAAEFSRNASGEVDEEARGLRDRIAYRNARGEDLFLGLGASTLRGEAGDETGKVVIFQDVSRVVSMERELRQSERLAAVGEMAARIAHEIRNPLASISGSVQILQGEMAPAKAEVSGDSPNGEGSEQAALMDIVVREVDRLNVLISDFLLYSRPTPLSLKSVDLSELIREVAKMGEGQIPSGVDLDLDLPADVEVMADPDQLRAVLWNLLNNALEAIEGTGSVVLRAEKVPGDRAQGRLSLDRNEKKGEESHPAGEASPRWAGMLEIEDTGSGISPELQETIFEPFYTTKKTGTGLGLATVQRIIEQHGGSIEMESEPDKGTRIRVFLPGPPASSEARS